MKTNVTPGLFGNSNEFPVINKIVEILIELDNDNKCKYCSRLLQHFNRMMSHISQIDKKTRISLCLLILTDFRNNLLKSYESGNIPLNLYTHLDNLIVGLYRKEILKIDNQKGYHKKMCIKKDK